MLKSTCVLTCLTWLLRCSLGITYAANTTSPTSLPIAQAQADAVTSEYKHFLAQTQQEGIESQKVRITPERTSESMATHSHTSEQGTPFQETTSLLPASDTSSTPLQNSEAAPSLSGNTTPDLVPTEPEGTIQSIIQYDAEDQIVFNVKEQTIRLHGAGIIEYDTIKLEAEEVLLDWMNHTIAAFSKKNKAGKVEKKAVLTKDGVEYIAESVRYNFESQRAIAKKLFTKQGDGILRAKKIKKDRDTTFYADQATYTTCDLKHPHFHADARNIKIINDDKVVSGPFNLYFDGVPTPLGFPFGIFYLPRGSGIIPPKYGGESERGFCLKNGGYYINFNDYADLALQGSVYSKGSTDFTAASKYKKRYQYGGDLSFGKSTHLSTQETGLLTKARSWELKWKHNTENNRTSSFNAEVHLKKEPSNGIASKSISKTPTSSTSSSIKYTNKLVGLPYTLGISLEHFQNFQTRKADATIPKTTLRTGNIYPFRKRGETTRHWYGDIYLMHNIEFKNKLSNEIDNVTLDFFKARNWPKLWRNGKRGIQQTAPLQTNIKILRYLNLTPKFEWRERWYWERIDYKYDTNGHDIAQEKVSGFARVYDYDFGTALKTTLYGTHAFGQEATIQALRHEFEPVVSFTYTPDFSGPEYGYWQTIKGGSKDGEKFNRFEQSIYGAPGKQATAVLKVDLNNRLDMKLKNNKNPQARAKKIPILESFNWSTSYDFKKQQQPWGDIQFKTHTYLFDKLFDISFKSTFDPYLYEPTGHTEKRNKKKYVQSNELAWNHGKGLGHMKNASLSIGAKLGPEARKNLNEYGALQDDQDIQTEEKEDIQIDPEKYMDFDIPWYLDLKYNWNYTCATPADTPQKAISLGLAWHMNLTKHWQVTCKSAYDLTEREWVGSATDIGIHRDLHCWEMDFNWNPLGDQQTYRFSVGLKAPLFKDLKYNRDRQYTKY